MKPYNFYKIVISHTKEKDNTRILGARLGLAKKTLSHLAPLGWSDEDITISISKMCNSLVASNRPCSFSYICGILLKTTSRPYNKSVSIEADPSFSSWIEAEIERLKNENA